MFTEDELELIQEAISFYGESIAKDPTLTSDEKYDKIRTILLCNLKIATATAEES